MLEHLVRSDGGLAGVNQSPEIEGSIERLLILRRGLPRNPVKPIRHQSAQQWTREFNPIFQLVQHPFLLHNFYCFPLAHHCSVLIELENGMEEEEKGIDERRN
jgi:hypothetical protein